MDECVPRRLKISFKPHDCQTVPEAGLSGKKNGALLNLAEGKFDVFITLDQGIQYQQNLHGRTLAIIVIRSKSNRFIDVNQHVEKCLAVMQSIQPGQLVVI